MEMVTGKCPECNVDILPAETQAQFNRNLGLHRRSKHGIAGRKPSYHPKRRKVEDVDTDSRYAKQVETLAKARRKRWREYKKQKRLGLTYKMQYKRRKNTENGVAPPGTKTSSEAVPCNLPACPNCGAKFYIVKSNG